MAYTPAALTELQERATPWDYEAAKDFASKYGLQPRSVVAKIGALGLPYKKKDAKAPSKPAAPKVSKADLAKDIENCLGLRLPSLEKMNAPDLQALLEWARP